MSSNKDKKKNRAKKVHAQLQAERDLRGRKEARIRRAVEPTKDALERLQVEILLQMVGLEVSPAMMGNGKRFYASIETVTKLFTDFGHTLSKLMSLSFEDATPAVQGQKVMRFTRSMHVAYEKLERSIRPLLGTEIGLRLMEIDEPKKCLLEVAQARRGNIGIPPKVSVCNARISPSILEKSGADGNFKNSSPSVMIFCLIIMC